LRIPDGSVTPFCEETSFPSALAEESKGDQKPILHYVIVAIIINANFAFFAASEDSLS
jgi:hypothetical protein